jgi:cellulose synthase/poly-beta-1,6-N-acetylglucosamine synthase-like glycosyltransferase
VHAAFAVALTVLDGLVVVYVTTYFAINVYLAIIAKVQVARKLGREAFRPPRRDAGNPFLPPLTLLVPAYNEEVTCIDSIRSLLGLDYPNYEIVICNDGSKDRTVEVLCEAFGFVRTDINYHHELETAPIRGLYQATCKLPPNVTRMLLVDKANGGKADALNAAINASQGVFVSSMDADSLLEPDALLRAMQAVADDPNNVVAIGSQVGLSNGSKVENGQVTELRLPRTWIGRFQIVEYMRSFTHGRTALGQLDSLLILSGVFALMRRDLVVTIGGFLTKHVKRRLVEEYCGPGAHTVCEDMEIVVRLHRYLFDRGRVGRILIDPRPVAWTEAPEVYRDLGKQRSRWYRGLLEVLRYHRAMLFRPRYGRIGMFSLPYQLLFEAAAPAIEALGYILVPLSIALGVFSPRYALGFLLLATTLNIVLSAIPLLLSVRPSQTAAGPRESPRLFSYPRPADTLVLFACAILSNFGYRQYLLYWQLRGLRDFVRGRKEWDKFARKGFGTPRT